MEDGREGLICNGKKGGGEVEGVVYVWGEEKCMKMMVQYGRRVKRDDL